MKKIAPIDLLLLAFSLTTCFAILELSLRVMKPQPTFSRLSFLAGSYYTKSEVTDWTLMPGFSGKMPSMEKPGETVEVNVDEYGFRKSKFSPSEIVTVVLGDSYTFGVYVDDEDTYVESLNKLSLANKTGEFFI